MVEQLRIAYRLSDAESNLPLMLNSTYSIEGYQMHSIRSNSTTHHTDSPPFIYCSKSNHRLLLGEVKCLHPTDTQIPTIGDIVSCEHMQQNLKLGVFSCSQSYIQIFYQSLRVF